VNAAEKRPRTQSPGGSKGPRQERAADGYERPRPREQKPVELLAPAGSKASWAAAVEAGADAVYLGLNNFSARAYADNFSLAELASVIRQSHEAGVRVYLALNSLIKEGELETAWKLLATSASFGPDALILQDLGLARLAARHFPELPRHASTLTAVHSLPGLIMLEKAGFSRAVLARELAFDEVSALASLSPIELEVFNHGALCFSFSGLCQMSSFLGGRSALRGACTQPCRRVYQRGGQKGAFFSTTDLSTAPYFDELRRLPLASFKIEGRMKGPDYVSRVVRAYRILLDAPDADWPYALADAENLLSEAPGRRTTGGPLAASIEGALAPLNATTSGIKLGFMEPAGPGLGRLTLERAVRVDDRLRLQVKAGEESAGFNLKSITVDGRDVDFALAGQEALLGGPNLPDQKGFLFKVSSGSEEKAFLASPLVKAVKEEAKKIKLPLPKALPAELKPRGQNRAPRPAASGAQRGGAAPALWVWLEKAEDLRELANFEARRIILPLTVPNVRHLRHHKRHLKNELSRLVWSLPPLIFHRRQNVLNQELGGLIEGGAREFLVSNIAQINMIQRAGKEASGLKIWGDHRLGFLNHLAEEALAELGLCGLTLSPEADADTFQRLWKSPGSAQRLLYLYGHPALFTARYPLETRQIPVVSPKGEKFRVSREGEETIVVAERPVFMGPLLKMPPLPNGAGFILDLRQEPHLGPKLRELKKALSGGGSGPGSSFNFKRTLL
jgi:putative protease